MKKWFYIFLSLVSLLVALFRTPLGYRNDYAIVNGEIVHTVCRYDTYPGQDGQDIIDYSSCTNGDTQP